MSATIESLLLIRALSVHVDRLRALLGDDWPAFVSPLTQAAQHLDGKEGMASGL